MKTVKDLMRNLPSSCRKSDSLKTVANLMFSHQLEFLPVINEQSEVIGAITYSEIQECIKAKNTAAENLCVADIMKTETCLINAHDDEAAALKLMRNNHTSYLPVVDEENHLKGVVNFVTLARRIVALRRQLRKDSNLKVRGLGFSS